MTWQEMYEKAYGQRMDLGREGTQAALALRQFELLGEENPQTREISEGPIERAFFAIGDECSRVNRKLLNFAGAGNYNIRNKQKYPLATMTMGAMSGFATTLMLLYAIN